MDVDFKVAEVELTYKPTKNKKGAVITASDAYKLILPTFPDDVIEYREYFKVLMLNHNNEVIAYNTVGTGGITECAADVRLIMQVALLTNATQLILVHNHPSGNLRPSRDDDRLTNQIVEAAKLLRIRVMDHLVISKTDYYSYAENGKI